MDRNLLGELGGHPTVEHGGGIANWLPARRATRIDPLEALRYE